MTLATFNPFDPAFRANPHPFYDALREHDPVHMAFGGLVVLTRYSDVATVLRSNDYSRDIEKSAKPVDDPIRKRMRERRRDTSKSILNIYAQRHRNVAADGAALRGRSVAICRPTRAQRWHV